ncbi:uncharacterized protein LOC133785236 [Humulus lupulus]|uniref:uncharacterized protein LOC133785236 n=1 Tax=Humulus lupulus TaxID=3486 RepID=UPI002B40D2D0|nr:uncharacterized protein LOC133785236 [Humulus lupulus]
MFSGWCFTSNSACHDGGRIIVSWNPLSFTVTILRCSSQFIHLFVEPVGKQGSFYVTFIYGFNEEDGRRGLWRDLQELSRLDSWIVMGDFNDILSKEERIGARVRFKNSVDFSNCVEACQLEDIKYSGNYFTWNNKQQGEERIFSKIDRVLANQKWLDSYPTAEAFFPNEGLFDHTPAILTVYEVHGTSMYQLVTKLKRLKPIFKEINQLGFSDLHSAVLKARTHLDACQDAVRGDPMNQELQLCELAARKDFAKVHNAYQSFLQQKAKLSWVKDGDDNTAFFHRSIRDRRSQNRVLAIMNDSGVWVEEPQQIIEAFLEYYKRLLGSTLANRKAVSTLVIQAGPVVSKHQAHLLQADYSMEEIKKAIFDIPGLKAPGLDGYGSYFFQDNWNLVGRDVYEAITSFLHTG